MTAERAPALGPCRVRPRISAFSLAPGPWSTQRIQGRRTGRREGRRRERRREGGRTNCLTRRREVKDEEPKSHQTWVIAEPSVSCLLNTF